MRRSSFIGFLLVVIVAFGPSAMGYFVMKNIEQRMSLDVAGTWVPNLFLPAFKLKNARVNWDERVRLHSGDLKIQYDPVSYVLGKPLGVKISGENLDIELLGEWSKMQSATDVKLSHLFADIAIGEDEIEGLNQIEAHGPQFQFSIKSTN